MHTTRLWQVVFMQTIKTMAKNIDANVDNNRWQIYANYQSLTGCMYAN